MATEVWPELTNIQDEDVLRRMWQETEDFGRKKEIRARMYKIREQRLKDFYTTGDTQSEVTVRKTKTHTESIGDQGSFLRMKSKEIRDSESPTRDISCTRRGETWSSSYIEDKGGAAKADKTALVQVHQSMVPTETSNIVQSSTTTSGSASTHVAQSSSVQTSKVSSQSIVQSSKAEVESHRKENSQISGQEIATQSNKSLRASGQDSSSATSEFQVTSGSKRISSESRIQQGGEQAVTKTRTIKQSHSGSPREVVTTTVTTYTSSDPSQPPIEQTSVRVIQGDDNTRGTRNENDQNQSSVVETKTIVKSEPQISYGVTESVSRSQQVQQSRQSTSSSYSTQAVSSSVQKTSSSTEKQSQDISVSNKSTDNHVSDSIVSNKRNNQIQDTSSSTNESKRFITHEQTGSSRTINKDERLVQNVRDQQTHSHADQVQITEVDASYQPQTVPSQLINRDSRIEGSKQDIVKSIDRADSQRNIQTTDEHTSRAQSVSRELNEQTQVKSSTTSTDQKIMNEIQKLDNYLSLQPTPSSSVPISPAPSSIADTNWPVDKEFVYTDTTPRDKGMVNGERSTPIRHPSNLELPKGATEGQYVTTYQHDYSPRVSRDHDINHQYFASTLRASPDRSSPSPSKRSSSKGSLDRSTPDRKFRGSPTRKTPDNERRLSSSSYTIERISDNKRYTSDTLEKSQTLPKDSKPKRKLSSTQTKSINKTRLSTPGTSPTTSPTRVQRPRKQSSSDSDSDHSNATFNKSTTSIQRKTDARETKQIGSTTRIQGSLTSINATDNETRLFSSPSPNRYPARENTPDYSSEGSITRELRTARNTEKYANTLDSSPERSAFSPIKSFRTSPERKNQTVNLINEERKHTQENSTLSNIGIDEVDVNERRDTRILTTDGSYTITPDSSPDRTSKDKPARSVVTETTVTTKKQQRTTPTSSPERKQDKPASKKPDIQGKNEPQRTSKTPDRKSPSKTVRNISQERQSPSKPRLYSSPSPASQRVPDNSRPKSNIGTEKVTNIKKVTKTTEDRQTRRSSIPRAESKVSPRTVREPVNKGKTSTTRDTSSVTRTTTSKIISPAYNRTNVSKSVDQTTTSHTRDIKSTPLKKPDIPGQKKPAYKRPTQEYPTKSSPYDKDKPKTKTSVGPKKESPDHTTAPLVNGRINNVTKVTNKKDQSTRATTVKKTKKEITHTDSKEMSKNKIHSFTLDDKDSNESIEDEQPPEEFYEDIYDRDSVDRELRSESADFISHETDVTVSSVCGTKKPNKPIPDAKLKPNTDESSIFISAEQTTSTTTRLTPTVNKTFTDNKPASTKPSKPKDTVTTGKKKPVKRNADESSSTSDEENDIIIKYDDYSEIKDSQINQEKITKRDVSKASLDVDKSKGNSLKVIVQHPKSSRESSPEKSIPMSVTSDGGQTPRYADFVTEPPEDVEVFDSRNLGPNKPIPSTLLDENRILEESEESLKESEKVSVAERVSKYIEKTNKIDIVTLETNRQQNDASSDLLRTKEIFEDFQKQPEEPQPLERRGSKKFSGVDEFIQNESRDVLTSSDIFTEERSVDTVDKHISTSATVTESVKQQSPKKRSIITEAEPTQQPLQTPKSHKQTPMRQPSNEDISKKPERRLSEHSPDIESKKAFFERKSKDIVITEAVRAPTKEPLKSNTPFDQKVPHYMKETATATTRKESIQKEFGLESEKDLQSINKEKRSSIDVERMDTFVKSEAYLLCKDSKGPSEQPTAKDFSKPRRSSIEVQELDTFKKTEAYLVCDDKTKHVTEKRSSVDLQKSVISSTTKKDSTVTTDQSKNKLSHSKSTERSPIRKTSKDKLNDRVPLKKKDTNIMTEERTSETTKTGKFGVSLRRTSSTGATPTQKTLQPEVLLPDNLPEIEDIFDVYILEILLARAVQYDERRRIRAQIRIVKKNLESEKNQNTSRKPQNTTKIERGIKEDSYQKKIVTSTDKTIRTQSPTKDSKHVPRTSPDRTTRTSAIDRKESRKSSEERRVSSDKTNATQYTVKSYTSPDKKTSVKETRTDSHRISSTGSPERRTTSTIETVTRKSTPYPSMNSERRTSSSYESKVESHSTYTRSSPERKIIKEEPGKYDTYSRTSEEKRRTSTEYERRSSKSSPERKISDYDTSRVSETSKASSRISPERKISKEFDMKSSYSANKIEDKSTDVRRSSRTSPERKVSKDYDSRRTSVTKTSRTSPDRKFSTDSIEHTRNSAQTIKTTSQYTTTTTSVGRKGEDSITSSYGVGPTDDQGRPLFGLRALRSTNRTTDETGEIEVGEDVGDGLVEDVRGSDGRPLFGLKALKSVTTTTTSSSVTTSSDMPSTQHLVQKHQQLLTDVKSSKDKMRGEVPRARLRDSFILDSDEGATSVVPALQHSQGVSLKSIIQKHEDMASNGKNVRREVHSTKTVTSSHGTITSDGKVSLSKQVTHGEMRGKDGAEPTGKISTSQYTYRSSDDPAQKPHVTSTTTTAHIGNGSHRNSITSVGEVRIEEIRDNELRRDSLVNSARKSIESKQKDDSKQTEQSWHAERKTIVRGDSVKALQHKFQQPTGVNQTNQKPSYPKAGLILRSNSLTQSDEQSQLSSSLKRVGEEEVRTTKEDKRIPVKDDREDATSRVSRTSTTTVSSTTTRRDSETGNNVSSTRHQTSTTTRDGSKSVTSFLDDTSKVTGVQDILQRMRNADLVTESTDTTEDSEARSLLNKFLGASVILQGMEAGGAGPASSALVSQVERQRILTSTQRKTDDVDVITDEKQLQILLEACSDYEQRRKIRARLRKIMAERKGQEELHGREGEERREEFTESRQITSSDGGTFTKTEVHKTSSAARLTKANSVQQSPFAKFRQLERQNSAPSGGALFKLTDPKLVRSASTIKDRLLCWARAQTSGYKNVQIENFSTSWSSGLAFCALIHHFYPDAFDYDKLTPESRRYNFELAFRIAEEKGDIYPLLDVEDMVAMRKPDWKCVFTYVQSIYRRLHNEPNAIKSI